MNENKLARLCWNRNKWVSPSGICGKSKNKESYEFNFGFGHEEWLLDSFKTIDGYHYGFLQGVNHGYNKHTEKIYNIYLYSYNSDTKKRWLIGKLNNVIVISKEENSKIRKYYEQNKWIDEMIEQLHAIGITKFDNEILNLQLNIKFKTEDMELESEPIELTRDDLGKSADYYVLMDYNPEIIQGNNLANFTPGHTKKTELTSEYTSESNHILTQRHNIMINAIYEQFVELFGIECVQTEFQIESHKKIDIFVRLNNLNTIYEIKTSNSAESAIREALGQILEYNHFPNKNRASKLVVISPNLPNKNMREYLATLREIYSINLYYQYYNSETNKLALEEF